MSIIRTFVVYDNGQMDEVKDHYSLCDKIARGNVETIVVGEFKRDGTLLWEKQFITASVMPSSFGRQP